MNRNEHEDNMNLIPLFQKILSANTIYIRI